MVETQDAVSYKFLVFSATSRNVTIIQPASIYDCISHLHPLGVEEVTRSLWQLVRAIQDERDGSLNCARQSTQSGLVHCWGFNLGLYVKCLFIISWVYLCSIGWLCNYLCWFALYVLTLTICLGAVYSTEISPPYSKISAAWKAWWVRAYFTTEAAA